MKGCQLCRHSLLSINSHFLLYGFLQCKESFLITKSPFPGLQSRVLYSAILQSDTAGHPIKLYYISLPSYHYCSSNFKVNVPIGSFVQIYTQFLLWGEVLRCGWTHYSSSIVSSIPAKYLVYGQVLELYMVVGIAMKGCWALPRVHYVPLYTSI